MVLHQTFRTGLISLSWSKVQGVVCYDQNLQKSARLVSGLELRLPPLSSQKNKMLIFGLCSTSDDRPGWSMDSNPIHHPSPAKKNEMLVFGLCSTSDDQPSDLSDKR